MFVLSKQLLTIMLGRFALVIFLPVLRHTLTSGFLLHQARSQTELCVQGVSIKVLY